VVKKNGNDLYIADDGEFDDEIGDDSLNIVYIDKGEFDD
jgi:hypothetical protein